MSWAVQGQVAVSETSQPLTTDRTPARDTLLIKALSANHAPVCVGEEQDAGYPLEPGQELSITPSGPNSLNRKPWDVWVSGTAGDRVAWISRRA